MPDVLSDGYAVGAMVLMALTGQPGVDLVHRCRCMLNDPRQPARWRAPGVPELSAGDWPERVACGLAAMAAQLVTGEEAERIPLPEALRQLDTMLLSDAAGEALWFSPLQSLWYSDC